MNFYPKKPKYFPWLYKNPLFSHEAFFLKSPPKKEKKKKESLGNMEARREVHSEL